MRPARTAQRARRTLPGNALLEFVLTLPILMFVTGLTIHMSLAMLTKQKALVDARYNLFRAAGHGWWTDMKLESWATPGVANPGTGGQQMPRGTGEELDRLHTEVAQQSVAETTNQKARDYFQRIWDNLPGRHMTESQKSFTPWGHAYDFLPNSAQADHWRDSSPWHYYHIDPWKIARSGPLREIFEAFRDNLPPNVAPHFKPTRDDIYNRWWHANDILDQESRQEQLGGGLGG
jgi:hypothetical protein